MGFFGGVKRQVKGRYHRAKVMRAGYKAAGISPLKRVRYNISDAFEQGKSNRTYKKQHGKAAYKKARKEDKAAKKFYRRKQFGF